MTSTATQTDVEQIRQLIANQTEALQARDAARMVRDYAPQIVRYDLAPPLKNSGPAVLNPARQQAWFEGFDGPIEAEVTDLEITAADGIAFAHGLNRLTATPRGMEQSFTLWFRATLGLGKIDGTWQITHEHKSTPFYMDGSFSAAIDLQP